MMRGRFTPAAQAVPSLNRLTACNTLHQQLADVRSPGLACVPVVNLLADLVAGYSISLLNTPFELIAFAIDRCEIIVSQFAPFLLDSALYHFPVSFNAIPIHDILHYESYNPTVFQNLCSNVLYCRW
jgi:hypothetical protein